MTKIEIYTMELGKVLEIKAGDIIIPVLDFTKEPEEILKCAEKFFSSFDIKNARKAQDEKNIKRILVPTSIGYKKWDTAYETPLETMWSVGIYNSVIVKLREHFGHQVFRTSDVIDLFEKHLRGRRGRYDRKTLGKIASAYLAYLVRNKKVIKLGRARYQFVFVKPDEIDKNLLNKIKDQEREVRRDI